MRGGVLQLSRWGLLDRIVGSVAPIRRTTSSYADEHATVTIKPSHGVDALYAPTGDLLERVLLEAAVAAGVEMHRRVQTIGVRSTRGRVNGVRLTISADESIELHAPVTIGADGATSVIGRATGASLTMAGNHTDRTTFACWRGLDTDGYEWIHRPGARLAVVPITDDSTLVFASASTMLIGGGGPGVAAALAAEAEPGLGERIRRAPSVDPGGTWMRDAAFIRRSSGPGWALVGEAGCYVDPIGPYGFTAPLRDAELLAEEIVRGSGGACPMDDALAAYEITRDTFAVAVFQIVEQLASPATTPDQVGDLLARLSSTMTDEIEAVSEIAWEVTS